MDKTVIILGAGPAGLTAALELANRGVKCIVIEADRVVGGLARTEVYKNYHFDIGGHRFYTKIDEVNQLWKDMLGEDLLTVPRLSRIHYYGKYFYYPLRPMNAFFGLGFKNSVWVTLSYLRSRMFPRLPEASFEDFVSNRFGRRLYHIFFKTYTEKVWGIPCNEIRAEWAAQRIRGLSFVTVVSSALFKRTRNQIKSLVEEFSYPRLGPGMMWNKFKAKIEAKGATVQLQSLVVHLNRENTHLKSVTVRRNGEETQLGGTHFISTLPLRDLILALDPPAPDDVVHAAAQLNYRDFLTVLLIIQQPMLFPDNWIYIHTPHVRVGRIQNYKNWSPAMVPDPNTTSLGMEYFVSEGDDLWRLSDEKLIEFAKSELAFLKLTDPRQVIDGTVRRMRKAYPIYDATYRENLSIVRGYLDAFDNLQTIGRNGLHRYNNQDHSMMTGILSARNLLGEKHDIWEVNTDSEYQEEIRLNI